jgi:hypothetical protein
LRRASSEISVALASSSPKPWGSRLLRVALLDH